MKPDIDSVAEWAAQTVTKDDTFVDIGADRGVVSLAARKAKKIIMVEPRDTVLPPIGEVVRCAVLNEKGEQELFFYNESPERSSFIDRFQKGEYTITKVPVTTVDEILKDVKGPIVMKIDTEFTEPLVWEGMKESLPKIRAMCIEFFPEILYHDSLLDPDAFLASIHQAGFKTRQMGYNLILER